MKIAKKLLFLLTISALLSACKPGPIYLNGGPPVAVKDKQGNVQYLNYKVDKKRVVMVPPSTGSNLMENKIRAAFAQDPILSQYPIYVSVHRGEVTLTGKVPNDNVRNYAIKVARYTKGVLMVHANNLVVTN